MKRIGWAVMTVLALIIAAYAIALLFVAGMRAPFLQERFITVPLAAYLHLAGAGIALAAGAFQHNGRIRTRYLNAHRWLGRTYVVSVLLGGSAALVLATMSQAGLVTHVGFGLLAVLWLFSTGMAYRYIRAGNQALHRRWMIRSYAFTFAAVTLRIYLPLSQVAGIPFDDAYQTISWLCWVPNLIVAEWIILRQRMPATFGSVEASMRASVLLVLTATATSAAAAQHPMHHGAATEHVLVVARHAAALFPDTAAARAAGYIPIEEMGIPDRNPFQGQHWYNGKHADTLATALLESPAFIMFAPVNGTQQRVAVAYSARLRLEAALPPGLGEDSTVMWHAHVLCGFTAPSGRPVVDQVGDTAVCRARGGTPRPRKTVMVHVWTDVSNPEGVYGHDNPALPFIALGLTPPEMSGRESRELALALGESYGARLENGYLIEQANTNGALVDSLRTHRAAISALVLDLRRAERAHDTQAYDRVASRIRAEGRAIERTYERMAKPDALVDLQRQYESILTTSMMH